MTIEEKLITQIKKQGINILKFVDISALPHKLNKGFPNAILLVNALSPHYLKKVSETPNYVEEMKLNKL